MPYISIFENSVSFTCLKCKVCRTWLQFWLLKKVICSLWVNWKKKKPNTNFTTYTCNKVQHILDKYSSPGLHLISSLFLFQNHYFHTPFCSRGQETEIRWLINHISHREACWCIPSLACIKYATYLHSYLSWFSHNNLPKKSAECPADTIQQ